MDVIPYNEFEIKASPYQLQESEEWTLDLYIAVHKGNETREKHFSAANTFKTREEAVAQCHNFGRKIIDNKVAECSIDDL